MPRIVLLSVVSVTVAIAAAIGFIVGRETQTATTAAKTPEDTAAVATATPAAATVSVETVEIEEETARYSIDIRYPQFGLATDAEIKQIAESAAADIRSLAAGSAPPTPGVKYSIAGYFDSIYIGPDAVSFRFVLSQYTGGAHGGSTIYGFNIHPETGRKLTLDDALSMLSLTLPQVAATSIAQLEEKLGEGFLFSEGAAPDPDNYSQFVIGADTVTFFFQEYQVAPYAAGSQEVSLYRQPAQ